MQTDRTVKIYNISENSYELSATLQGHEGPVWQVSWAHPKFGVLLASCSFDGSVLIHREVRPREWTLIHAARQLHDSSVNGVAFLPGEFGTLELAAASSDGRVSILTHQPEQQTWTVDYIENACPMGVNALSWAPFGAYYNPSTDASETSVAFEQQVPRLVTAGCDNTIQFWVRTADGEWKADKTAILGQGAAHTDWVRDVAWAPGLVPNHNIVASCSEDGSVIIWKQEPVSDEDESKSGGLQFSEWKPTLLHTFDEPVWRVSWSVTGHLLAVSSGDCQVTLWKAGLDGQWSQVKTEEEQQQLQT